MIRQQHNKHKTVTTHALARRHFLSFCSTALVALAAVAVTPLRALAESAAARFDVKSALKAENLDEAIGEFAGGATVSQTDDLLVRAPLIAENGNVVPIEVDATALGDGVDTLAFFVANNPRPLNSVYHFAAAEPSVSFRVRMLESTQVVAVARLSSGQYVSNSADVKVTTGGCGG